VTYLTGVAGQFTARHIDPHLGEGEHEHTWQVVAWYPAEPWRDGRALKEALGQLLGVWNGTLLPRELWSGESLAKAVTELLANCVGADISRPIEGFYAQYRRNA